MPKYKVLKSVAHNTGHSLIGATDWYDGAFPFEHLRDAARAVGARRVNLDLLRGHLEPTRLRSPALDQFAELDQIVLRNLLRAEGWTPDDLQAAALEIDLDAPSCVVEIVDNRGRHHTGNVVQWGISPAG
jgi:hypothetical protein